MKNILLVLLMCSFSHAFSQDLIKGRVIDAIEGAPLIGVNILNKETQEGCITDADGHFNLFARKGNVIVFKYIGYATQEVTVSDFKELLIKLNSESVNLQEVVAIGYGTVKKRDLTGAVSSVKGADIAHLQAATVGQALAGKLPGVFVSSPSGESPGSSPEILIRGENSINGSNSPLWVIDGFTRSGGATTINPEDIESIEVLKDASATAVYGSRGAGGVIIVTTKKGAIAIKPTIDFKASFGIRANAKELKVMTGPEYYQYRINSGIDNYFDESINPKANYNWKNAVVQNAFEESYFLSLYGGSKDLNYKISTDYLSQNGVIKYNNDYRRFNLRSNFDININKYIKAGLMAFGQRIWKNNGGSGSTYQTAISMSPLIPIYTDDGSYNHLMDERDQSVISSNFIESLRYKKDKDENNTINFQAYISAEVFPGLTLKTSGGINYYTNKSQYFSPKRLDLKNYLNNASASEYQSNEYEWITTLSYTKKISKIHSLNAMLGFTYENSEGYTVGASGSDFPTDNFGYWAIGSGPQYELTGDNSLPLIRNSGTTSYNESTLMSYLGRINYSLLDRYLFTFTGRYDGASQLAIHHKWAFFPSVAFAWRASEESFIRSLNLFDNLKFRLSWGITGSQGVDSYSTLGLASQGDYTIQDGIYAPVYSVTSLSNPKLTWEKTSQIDIGADFVFFDNRLRVIIDYYNKRTLNMFVTKNLPAETGYGSYLSNDGKMQNRGFELGIDGDLLSTEKWKVSTGFNFSLNENKILYMGGSAYKVFTNKNSYGELLSYNYVGKPISLIYGWKYDGIWQTEEEIKYGAVDVEAGVSKTHPGDMRYKDINNDGKIDAADKVLIMNPNPDFIVGMNSSITYKEFTLSFLLQGIFGHQIYNYAKKDMFNRLAFRKNAWTEENHTQSQPSAGNENIKDSDYFVEDGSFVKLRNITLSYLLPLNIIKKIGIASAEFYCSGKDLLTITGYSGYNPEVSRNGNSESFRGVDYNSYPSTRSVYCGLKVTF